MFYLLRLGLNLLTFFASSFLLLYIYIRTWKGQMSKFFKACSFIVGTLYFLSLHDVVFTFILITVLNTLTTYIFVKYGRFSRMFTFSTHDDDDCGGIVVGVH